MANKNLKILVVDDEKDIVEFVERKLQQEGYATVCAYDGEEALLKVKSDNPDMVILDLTMPKLNGFEVLKEIRNKHNDKWRPVIIVSGNSEMESLKKGYNMEADLYLNKPCEMENLLRGIKTLTSFIPLRI
ncbi:MAG: response regulator [Candidatus Omnitrophica bacterium]|nr:response regulator [Candidatus Omnitrophota bacterium]